jgi:hypothetical protein
METGVKIMSVHKAISEHSKTQNKRVEDFILLDQERERLIEDAIAKCKENLEYDVAQINKVTLEINELARKGIVPGRKLVTKEMVAEFVERLSQK